MRGLVPSLSVVPFLAATAAFQSPHHLCSKTYITYLSKNPQNAFLHPTNSIIVGRGASLTSRYKPHNSFRLYQSSSSKTSTDFNLKRSAANATIDLETDEMAIMELQQAIQETPADVNSFQDDLYHTKTSILSSATSVVLLNIVAVIWGTQHAVIKSVLTASEASASASATSMSTFSPITDSGFTLSRFALAALVVIMYTPNIQPFFQSIVSKMGDWGDDQKSISQQQTQTPTQNDSLVIQNVEEQEDPSVLAWRWGLEMGLWMFLGYAFQAIGLEYTSAQRSGFLLYLNVKFVPFFAFILLSRQISIPTWASAFVAFFGTALLSFGDSSQLPFNIGDVWSIAAAMASAMFILRMEKASAAVTDSASLNAACVWTVTLFALVWNMVEGGMTSISISSDGAASLLSWNDWMSTFLQGAFANPMTSIVNTFEVHPFAMLYLGAIATALANYIQTFGQQNISAERASIIYAMDPVYGAFFANLLLGETLGTQGMIGAGLITVAAATNAFLDFGNKDGKNNKDDSSAMDDFADVDVDVDVDIDGKAQSSTI